MSKYKSNKEFISEIKKLVDDEYTFLDEYSGFNTKIRVKHNTCGRVYKVTPTAFLSGKRCSDCQHKVGNRKRTRTNEWFINKIKELVGDEYTPLSEYKLANSHVIMRHNKCGNVYKVTPSKFINVGRRCPVCMKKQASINNRKDTNWFQSKVTSILGNHFKVISEYTKADEPIRLLHLDCGRYYDTTPRIVIDVHTGCPYCDITSKGELMIREYLEDNSIKYISQFKPNNLKDKRNLSYDFYLPDNNVLIEYQGIQHYEPRPFFGEEYFKTQVKHDRIKKEFANANGYHLICIPYSVDTQNKINKTLESVL